MNGVFQHHDVMTYIVSFLTPKAPKEDDPMFFYCFESTANGNTLSAKVEFKYDNVEKAKQLVLDQLKAKQEAEYVEAPKSNLTVPTGFELL